MAEGTEACSPIKQNERSVKKFWFDGLTPEEQEDILSPHFEAANPTDADKKERTREYEEF